MGNSPFTRVDPPKFSTSSGLGFSIDAALSGTIPSYASRQRHSSASSSKDIALPVSLHEPQSKDSWFFDIHEDTPEELATNLMEHSTCTLDISSDEESVARMKDERGKENVPPVDDISQTRATFSSSVDVAESSISDLKARITASRRRREVDEGAIDIDRSPLGDLAAEDFYAEGCDGESVVLIPSEAGADAAHEDEEGRDQEEVSATFDFTAEVSSKGKERSVDADIDALMMRREGDIAPNAALFGPIEKAEEGFAVWESGSAKGDD